MKRLVVASPNIGKIKAKIQNHLYAYRNVTSCELVEDGADRLTLMVPEKHEDKLKSLLLDDMFGCLHSDRISGQC